MYGYKPTGTLRRIEAGHYVLAIDSKHLVFGQVVRTDIPVTKWSYFTEHWPYVSGYCQTKKEAVAKLQAILLEREQKEWIPS